MYYTNGSKITKTFHGVTFKPGETKEVFGTINDPKFVLSRQEPPQRDNSTSSKSEVEDTPKKTTGKSATKPAEKESKPTKTKVDSDDKNPKDQKNAKGQKDSKVTTDTKDSTEKPSSSDDKSDNIEK